MELLPLVCLCLLSCSGDAVRVVVEQDSDAVLPCLISTKEDITGELFDWRKDGQDVFLHDSAGRTTQGQNFTGRVSFFQDQLQNGNASIKITRTKMADSGNYSCDFPRHQPRQTSFIELVVAVRVVVEEDSDAVLPCWISPKEDISYQAFVWKKDGQRKKEVFKYDAGLHYNNGLPGQDDQFKGRVSFFQDQLQNGDASIKITGTKMADSGNYSCDFPRHQPSQTSIIELVVDRVLKDRTGENLQGAASKPSVTTIQTDGGMMLQCEVLGAFPKPKVEWKDSSGNILQAEEPQVTESGGRYDIVLRAALTKTDTFRCVVTQEEISHQISDEIYVVNGAAPKPYISTLRDTKYWRLLQCEARGVPPLTVEWKNAAGNILNRESTPKSETGSPSYIALNITVTKTDDYSCVATQKQFRHQVAAVTSVYIQVPPPESGSNTGLVAGVVGVVAVIVTLIAVGVILYYLSKKGCITVTCKKGSTPDTANGPPAAESSYPMIREQSAPV